MKNKLAKKERNIHALLCESNGSSGVKICLKVRACEVSGPAESLFTLQ